MKYADYGKTLLEALRAKSNVKSKSISPDEIGGMILIVTAFQVNDVAFLDVPVHAAFASIYNSSKASTDVLTLVVDYKEGAQEQTNEIVNLCLVNDGNSNNDARYNETLIFAMTKIDESIKSLMQMMMACCAN